MKSLLLSASALVIAGPLAAAPLNLTFGGEGEVVLEHRDDWYGDARTETDARLDLDLGLSREMRFATLGAEVTIEGHSGGSVGIGEYEIYAEREIGRLSFGNLENALTHLMPSAEMIDVAGEAHGMYAAERQVSEGLKTVRLAGQHGALSYAASIETPDNEGRDEVEKGTAFALGYNFELGHADMTITGGVDSKGDKRVYKAAVEARLTENWSVLATASDYEHSYVSEWGFQQPDGSWQHSELIEIKERSQTLGVRYDRDAFAISASVGKTANGWESHEKMVLASYEMAPGMHLTGGYSHETTDFEFVDDTSSERASVGVKMAF